jgi:hypothetical protein
MRAHRARPAKRETRREGFWGFAEQRICLGMNLNFKRLRLLIATAILALALRLHPRRPKKS